MGKKTDSKKNDDHPTLQVRDITANQQQYREETDSNKQSIIEELELPFLDSSFDNNHNPGNSCTTNQSANPQPGVLTFGYPTRTPYNSPCSRDQSMPTFSEGKFSDTVVAVPNSNVEKDKVDTEELGLLRVPPPRNANI